MQAKQEPPENSRQQAVYIRQPATVRRGPRAGSNGQNKAIGERNKLGGSENQVDCCLQETRMYLNNNIDPVMTSCEGGKLPANSMQQLPSRKLYRTGRMKMMLSAIAASFCLLFHSIHLQKIAAQETSTISPLAASASRKHETKWATSQITTTTTIYPDNKLTTPTIFKIHKQALHNSSSSEQQSWLIDKSESPPATGADIDEPPRPLASLSSGTASSSQPAAASVAATVTPSSAAVASSSRAPPVLRPSIEEVASKLSRKHLNLEHDNWRLRQSSSSSSVAPLESSADEQQQRTKSTAAATMGLAPSEAEQDVQMMSVSSAASDPDAGGSLLRPQPGQSAGAAFFSAPSAPKLTGEGQHNVEHYLHVDAASALNQQSAKSRQQPAATGRRRKSNYLSGEALELAHCHRYLGLYNMPASQPQSSVAPTPLVGLYQQQLPCSCEMSSLVFELELTNHEQASRTQSATRRAWLNCDHVQLVGAANHQPPQSRASSNASSETWEMGSADSGGAGASSQQLVTRFSQRQSGLQTLHAQKFLNLQLSGLQSIDLRDNRLRQIKSDAFHGLESSLENLNLANNLLGDARTISSAAGQQQQQQQQSISIFSTDELSRLKALKWLSLRNNRINQLSSSIFTKRAQHSTQSASFIRDSTSGDLVPQTQAGMGMGISDSAATSSLASSSPTSELVFLDLSENILKSVPSDAIQSLDKLQVLSLRGNKITQLDQASKFPSALKYLDLSENLIKIIRNCDLIDLADLIELNLSHNQLSQLDKSAFVSASALAVSAPHAAGASLTIQSPSNADGGTSGSSLSSSGNLIVPSGADWPRASSESSQLLTMASGGAADSNNNNNNAAAAQLTSSEGSKSLNLVAAAAAETSLDATGEYKSKVGEELHESQLSLDAHRVEPGQRQNQRTRRDVISGGQDEELGAGSSITDDDDEQQQEEELAAEESSSSGSFASAPGQRQQSNSAHPQQRTLVVDEPPAMMRKRREFNATTRLNLAHNYFTNLPGDSLLKFSNLQQLDLSFNRIRYLDSNYLCSVYNLVESLRELDLRGNLLTLPQANNNTAPPQPAPSRQLNLLFGCLQKLERLSLGTNRLSSASNQPRHPSRGPSAVTNNADENSADEDSTASTSSDSPVRLQLKFGDNYGSRFLNRLDLSDNQLRLMPLIEQVFQQPSSLLNGTRGAITTRNESDQQQQELNQWMASRVYLVDLDLSYNYIERLEERDFDHLLSLRHLSLDFNRLSNLPGRLMRKFTSLDRASFDANRLSSLEPLNELFERSTRTLRYLSLANNRLTVWPAINKPLHEDHPVVYGGGSGSGAQSSASSPQAAGTAPDSSAPDISRQVGAFQFALEELNLEGNLFTSANASTLFDQLAHMRALRSLNLGQNLLNRVRSEWFKFANENLKILLLAGNKINSIDLGSFVYNQLNELQTLDLSYNLLKELKRKTFDSLPRLRDLDLSHNAIHTINSETFHQMSSMRALNLSNNKLTSWKCEYFSNFCNSISGNINAGLGALLADVSATPPPLDGATEERPPVSSLIELDLSHNSLSQLRVNSISVHTKLERLNLAHNKLSYIPHDLFRASVLDSRTGRQIQLASALKWLSLAHNRIQTLDNINLRPLRNLVRLDLSHNELQTLGSDVIYEASGAEGAGKQRQRNIIVVGTSNSAQRNASSLDAPSANSSEAFSSQHRQSKSLQQQRAGFGAPALGKLRHLNLAHNQLVQVNQSLLHELSPFVLLNLDLSHNYLESELLPYGFYAKIAGPTSQHQSELGAKLSAANQAYDLVFTLKLESLNLAHNRLSEFPATLLENHHISMESCSFAHNRIQTLAPNSNVLIQIKSLDLEFNPLSRESNELILFEHKAARQLNLAATRLYAINEVSQLTANLDAKTQAAHKQRLAANQTSQLDLIRSISRPIDAPHVQHLNLSSNQLVWLAANIFERMHSLQTLDLSNNQLTRLHMLTNQLAPLSASLESLSLGSNLFTSIDATDFSQLTRLRRLDLSSLLSLQKLNCRFLSKLTTLRSLRLFNFPQVRQNLNNIILSIQQRAAQQQQRHDSHASSIERMLRKLHQELLMSTIGGHCFRDELIVADDELSQQQQQQRQMKWFNLRELELELFSAFGDDDDDDDLLAAGAGRGGFQLQHELAQLLGPETSRLALFGLNLTSLAEDSLLGITSRQLDLKISYTSLARLPLEQVLSGVSKRTKLKLDFRNNNVHSLDVGNLQALDELQLNEQILQKNDHSSLQLASNPVRCDCQTRPLWLWLNQRWANLELPTGQQQQQPQQDEPVSASSSTSGANYWLKFSSVSRTSDIRCHYPVKLRGKLAQHVNYHELVCKGSLAAPVASGRQSRKRNETRVNLELLSYYSRDGASSDGTTDGDDLADGGESLDYLDSPDATPPGGAAAATSHASTAVRVTKFNRFPSLVFNQTIHYLQNIPVPFISDLSVQGRREHPQEEFDFEPDSSGGGSTSRVGKRDRNSANALPVYPILGDEQIVNTRYSKHRPNTQQRHASFDSLTTLKQLQPAHHHHYASGQRQILLTDSDVYILTVMSIAMSIMSFIIITICLFKYRMDRSDKERILSDHGKMLMSQALFNMSGGNQLVAGASNSASDKCCSASKKSSSSSGGSSGSGSGSRSSESNKSKHKNGSRQSNLSRHQLPSIVIGSGGLTAHKSRHAGGEQSALAPMQLKGAAPSSLAMPASAAQNFLMRSPTIRRMQGLATNASDWFKYTLRAYPSNAAMHRVQRRGRLFLGATVPVASQLATGKRAIEEQLAAASSNEPGSPATLAVGCPQHAFRAIDRLRSGRPAAENSATRGPIEERCLHCARLLATIQQTKVQYLIGDGGAKQPTEQQHERSSEQLFERDQRAGENGRADELGFVPPSLIRALAEQLDQASAQSNYVALRVEELQQRQRENDIHESSNYQRRERVARSMRTFGVVDRDNEQTQQHGATADNSGLEANFKESSQIPSVDVIGRFAYQSDSQVDTPTPYDARCSSILGSSQMDGSEDTNGHYNTNGAFNLVPDESSDEAPVSVLLNSNSNNNNRGGEAATARNKLVGGESRLAESQQQEGSIRMQDECSRSSSPVAYGFMRSSGPSSLASSGAAQTAHHQNHGFSNYAHHFAPIPTQTHPSFSGGGSNNNNYSDHYSVVRKKRDERNYERRENIGSTEKHQDEQVIISRL